MTMLNISWRNYKRLWDTLKTRKPMSMSGLPFYLIRGNNYVIYFSTPDFEYRCIVPKNQVSKVDASEYILFGIEVEGRVE